MLKPEFQQSRLRFYNHGVNKPDIYQIDVFKMTIGGMYVSLSDCYLLPPIITMSQLPPGIATSILGGAFIGLFLDNILVSPSVIY
jgi:hypothetical protein